MPQMMPNLKVSGDEGCQVGMPRVTAIVLNWNLWQRTIRCLESVVNSDYPNFDVIVVDNGSTDDSCEEIDHWIELRTENLKAKMSIRLVRSEMNLGYSGGNNLGIRAALSQETPEYVLLLNNDIVVSPDTISVLTRHAVDAKDFAFLGPKLLYLNTPSIVQSKGMHIVGPFLDSVSVAQGEVDESDVPGILDADSVYGACMLVRVSHLKLVGGLDEVFFIYGEETDWCIRAKRLGFRVGCVPSTRVWHEDQISGRKLGETTTFHLPRGRAILIKRYSHKIGLFHFALQRLPRMLSILTASHRRPGHALAYLKGFLDGCLTASGDRRTSIQTAFTDGD